VGESLAIKQKVEPDSLDAGATLGNLGLAYFRRGDLAKAQDYTQREFAAETANGTSFRPRPNSKFAAGERLREK
jgi:Tfp pilus assembly protein PilF